MATKRTRKPTATTSDELTTYDEVVRERDEAVRERDETVRERDEAAARLTGLEAELETLRAEASRLAELRDVAENEAARLRTAGAGLTARIEALKADLDGDRKALVACQQALAAVEQQQQQQMGRASLADAGVALAKRIQISGRDPNSKRVIISGPDDLYDHLQSFLRAANA